MQAPIVHTNLRQSMFAKKKNLNDCSPVSPGNSNKLAHLPTSSDQQVKESADDKMVSTPTRNKSVNNTGVNPALIYSREYMGDQTSQPVLIINKIKPVEPAMKSQNRIDARTNRKSIYLDIVTS